MAIVEHFVRFIKNVAINQRNTTNLVQQITSMVGLISHSVDVWGSLALVRLLFSPSDPCFFFFSLLFLLSLNHSCTYLYFWPVEFSSSRLFCTVGETELI